MLGVAVEVQWRPVVEAELVGPARVARLAVDVQPRVRPVVRALVEGVYEPAPAPAF